MDDFSDRRDPADLLGHLPLQILEQGWRLFQQASSAGASGTADYAQALQSLGDQTRQLLEQLTAQHEQWHRALKGLLEACDAFSGIPIDENATAAWPWLAPMASLFGADQLKQRRSGLEKLSAAAETLRDAQAHYLRLLEEMADESQQEVERLLQPDERRQPLTLERLYALWVSAGERAHERFLESQRYADAFSRLVNAHTAFAEALQGMFEQLAKTLDLPTRQDLLETQRELQELRRQMHRQDKEARRLELLEAEVAELRQALRALSQAEGLRTDAE